MKKKTPLNKFQTQSNKFEIENAPKRLREAIRRAGGNNLISERSGVPLGTLNGYISGRSTMRIDAATALADTCGVSLNWLVRGEDDDRSLPAQPQSNRDLIDIPFVPTEASAGFGLLPSHAEEVEYVPVSRQFLYRCLGLVPKGLVMIRVVGDSMTPTIAPNDRLIIDTAPCSITHGIYVIVVNEAVYVKRVGLQDTNNYKIISDNPQYPAFSVPMTSVCWGNAQPEAEMRIVGRVVINCHMMSS